MKYIDNENCFFFRSAVIDIFEGWRIWIQSESVDPLEIWVVSHEEIVDRYWPWYKRKQAKIKARKLDKEIERLFQNDRIGIIDTDISLDDE